jgi:hypothetical protein
MADHLSLVRNSNPNINKINGELVKYDTFYQVRVIINVGNELENYIRVYLLF